MHDRDRSIEGQAILKSILESPWVGKLIDEGTTLESIFDLCAKKLDDYAGIKEPLKSSISSPPGGSFINAPLPPTFSTHLSDEQVAAGVEREAQKPSKWPEPHHVTLKNGQKAMFATAPQHGRAYAIAMSHGWDNKSLKNFLFEKYGISDNRKGIYACFYDEIISKLERGPLTGEGSEGFGSGYQYQPEKS